MVTGTLPSSASHCVLIGFEENYSRFMEVVGDDTELFGPPLAHFSASKA